MKEHGKIPRFKAQVLQLLQLPFYTIKCQLMAAGCPWLGRSECYF